MWFTYIYALIIAGTLGMLAKETIKIIELNWHIPVVATIDYDQHIPVMVVILFLILFSVIGTFIIFKLNIEYHNFKIHADKVLKELNLDEYMAPPLGGLIKQGKFKAKLIPVGTLFLLFYTLSLSGLFALAIFIYFKNGLAAVLVFLVLFILVFAILYWYQGTIMDRIDKSVNSNDKARN